MEGWKNIGVPTRKKKSWSWKKNTPGSKLWFKRLRPLRLLYIIVIVSRFKISRLKNIGLIVWATPKNIQVNPQLSAPVQANGTRGSQGSKKGARKGEGFGDWFPVMRRGDKRWLAYRFLFPQYWFTHDFYIMIFFKSMFHFCDASKR